MELSKLASKDRALLVLKVLMMNGSPMVHRSYVIEKIEACIGFPFPEQMLDQENRATFDRLVGEVK